MFGTYVRGISIIDRKDICLTSNQGAEHFCSIQNIIGNKRQGDIADEIGTIFA
jgi:hypothetical protein